MFEYGKDIPLEGAVADQMKQHGDSEGVRKTEASTLHFDHRKEIPLDGIKD